MITMDLQTWGQIAVLAGTAFTICGLILRAIGKLDTKIDATREELRTEFKTDIAGLTTILLRLDERAYDLVTGNRQSPLIIPPH